MYNSTLSDKTIFGWHYIVWKGIRRMKKDFLICGLTGWCLEILFTSFGALCRRDFRMIGQTSLWMFPIYGMAALIRPVYRILRNHSAFFRGMFYSAGIFCCEYFSGSFLKKHHLCPWDYSSSPFNINGVIRLDYAPLWMAAGLIFERILAGNSGKNAQAAKP